MYYTYILRSQNDPSELYTGYTRNIKKRLQYHNDGLSSHTEKKRPWVIDFIAVFKNKYLAIKFEKYLKSPSGKAFRNKRLIEHKLYDNLQSSEDC
jgi:predicted GIY-YIG superfamily endonuclease